MNAYMKTYLIPVAASLLAFAACNQPAKQDTSGDSITVPETTAPLTGQNCFIKTIGQDTFFLKLNIDGANATGDLVYNFYEKDDSKGAIKGTIENNIFHGSYEFSSEGVITTQPVIFKLEGNKAYEAVADSITDQGTPVFPDNNGKVKFDPEPYSKTACK